MVGLLILQGSVFDLHYEVLPESETSFSVTFQRPDTDSLAVCEHLPYNISKTELSFNNTELTILRMQTVVALWINSSLFLSGLFWICLHRMQVM